MDQNKKRTTHRKITVPFQMSMWRLDRILSHALDSWSRKDIGELVSAKAVGIGGEPAAKGTKKVRGGEEIEIDRKKYRQIDRERKKRNDIASFAYTGKVSAVVPEEIPLDIVYEDEQLLVVDKPAGMVIHPAYANTSGTLANAVAWYFRKSGIPIVRRIGLVHRLDKDVSGLVMIAKNDLAMEELSRQFSSEGIQHGYIDLSTKAWKYYRAEVEERGEGMLRAAGFAVGNKKLVEGWVRRSKTDRRKYEFIKYRPEMTEDAAGKYAASYMTLISHRNSRIELQVQTQWFMPASFQKFIVNFF